MKKKKNEIQRLDRIATTFSMFTGFNGRLEKFRVMTVKEQLKGKRILDVGCADGHMAQQISKAYDHITAIDGSRNLIDKAKKMGLKNVDFICSLFEDFQPKIKFDGIILSDILEHIDRPDLLLKLTKKWIKKDGRIIIICPNANSIHRQIGVLSGMLNDIHELNATDKKVGHRRVYDIQLLQKELHAAGLKIVNWGGFFFKPLSNDQMNVLDDNVVDAFYLIGKRLPQDLLTELYVACKK